MVTIVSHISFERKRMFGPIVCYISRFTSFISFGSQEYWQLLFIGYLLRSDRMFWRNILLKLIRHYKYGPLIFRTFKRVQMMGENCFEKAPSFLVLACEDGFGNPSFFFEYPCIQAFSVFFIEPVVWSISEC